MATIQDYLNQIKNAIYGKDVRQAIHDGIQQCYYDGKAGSTDLEARQRLDSAEGSISSLGSRMSTAENDIDVLDSRVDQIVAPSGEAPSAAEVSDARVGADGTIYTSLGDAVRGQVTDLKNDLGQLDLTGYFEIGTFTVDTGNQTLTYVNSNKKIRTKNGLKLPLRKGTKVGLSDYNDKKYYVAWYSGGTLYQHSGWLTSDYVLTADGDYVFLISTVSDSDIINPNDYSQYFFGYNAEFAENINNHAEDIDGLKALALVESAGYVSSTGSDVAQTSANEVITQYIPIVDGVRFDIHLQLSAIPAEGIWIAYALYGDNKAFISRTTLKDAFVSGSTDAVVQNINTSAKYIRFMYRTYNGCTATITTNKHNAIIEKAFIDTENRINNITQIDTRWSWGFVTSLGLLYPPDPTNLEKYSDMIPTEKGQAIELELHSNSAYSMYMSIAYYDSERNFISRTNLMERSTASYSTRLVNSVNNSKYFRISYRTFGGAVSIGIRVECPCLDNSKAVTELSETFTFEYNPIVKSIRHRGGSIVPENTLPAFIDSKRIGFKYVETDVVWTSDGVPVLLHDDTINRTARNADGSEITQTINIAGITYNQVLNYDFGIWKGEKYAGTKIPTFTEFIALCKKLGLYPYIEIKNINGTEAQVTELVEIVKDYGMNDNVTWLSGADYTMHLRAIKSADPTARIGLVVISPDEVYLDLVEEMRNGGNEVFFDSYTYTSEDVELCKANNIPMEAWTINSAENILNLPVYVSGVTSDEYNAGYVMYKDAMKL